MEEEDGYTWERAYEKTWEALTDDSQGDFESSVANYLHAAKIKRMLERKSNVRLGVMRHVFVIIDMSDAMNEKDMQPCRLLCALKALDSFLDEFFDQNPISQIGLIITKEKRAEKICDLSGDVRKHKEAVKSLCEASCTGEPSLQNAFDLALRTLKNVPSHTSREILVIQSSLSSCDPGNIYSTIELLRVHKVRCSIVGLSAEVHVCRIACQSTGGAYDVVLDQKHLKDSLTFQTAPPYVGLLRKQFLQYKVPRSGESGEFHCALYVSVRFSGVLSRHLDSRLLRMGFPEHQFSSLNEISLCQCHGKAINSGHFCPQCKCKQCSLPTECKICGLTLVLAPHLARSYHHFFPTKPFKELTLAVDRFHECYACLKTLEYKAYSCEKCWTVFCMDCESFVQDTLHLCPRCCL